MNTAAKRPSSPRNLPRLVSPLPGRSRTPLQDFDPKAYDELSVLPPERVRGHLARFDEALATALADNLQCNQFEAENLVSRSYLFGFQSLSGALSAVFFDGTHGSGTALPAARMAIEKARPKIAELLRHH